MKYLFIFLPIFCFAQGGDSTLYSVRFDSIITHDGFLAAPNSSGFIADRFELYCGDFRLAPPKPKVVESFKYLGAYYELRENGWYKKILPDTIPKNTESKDLEYIDGKLKAKVDYSDGSIKFKGDSAFQWAEGTKWISCDQHIGVRDMPKRDNIDRTRANILVWNGCTMAELEVYKITHYNEMTVAKNTGGLAIYIPETIRVDIVTEYLYDGGWIKSSHVIKEL